MESTYWRAFATGVFIVSLTHRIVFVSLSRVVVFGCAVIGSGVTRLLAGVMDAEFFVPVLFFI